MFRNDTLTYGNLIVIGGSSIVTHGNITLIGGKTTKTFIQAAYAVATLKANVNCMVGVASHFFCHGFCSRRTFGTLHRKRMQKAKAGTRNKNPRQKKCQ